MNRNFKLSVFILIFLVLLIYSFNKLNFNFKYYVGESLDSLNGVTVYYNGGVSNIEGRNLTEDGYNLGMKYQCVEFVKRYYYEYLNHKMPESYGNAKDFFDNELDDGELNKDRNLMQYGNPSISKPKISDLIVFDGSILNAYGHVAIISNVSNDSIEIIQQNPGPFGKSRRKISLTNSEGMWIIEDKKVLGRLRKE